MFLIWAHSFSKHFLKADFYENACAGLREYKNQEDTYLEISLQPSVYTI